jgi:hypothetical protein
LRQFTDLIEQVWDDEAKKGTLDIQTYAKKMLNVFPADAPVNSTAPKGTMSLEEMCAGWDRVDTSEVCRIFYTALTLVSWVAVFECIDN